MQNQLGGDTKESCPRKGASVTDYNERFKTLATNVIHAGTPNPRINGAVVSPVFQSANLLMAGLKPTMRSATCGCRIRRVT